MVIGINCGHTASGAGSGAVGLINESEHTRYVGRALMAKFRAAGVTVIDCTIDKANTQNEYLSAVTALANRQDLDWFISIHFNASAGAGHGVEAYTYEGRQYPDALAVCKNIAELGFKNRGVKTGTGLYVISKTKAKALLIEVCFCDNKNDVELYQDSGFDTIAQAIFNGIYDYVVEPIQTTENHNMSRENFIEYVGNIAKQDWTERRICLPSVVVAQAMKESGCGTSELAQNAMALFGIKKNGWIGKTYIKVATEQRPDGSYYQVDSTEWRAYDSWQQSVIDHNDYIATRKVGNQQEPNWNKVVGCDNYVLAVQYLQDAQYKYATSITYEQSLVNDYIEKYDLTRFDVVEDEIAPEGTAWVVQFGAYRSKQKALNLQKRLVEMGVSSVIKQYDKT